jgi:hypothetical protein
MNGSVAGGEASTGQQNLNGEALPLQSKSKLQMVMWSMTLGRKLRSKQQDASLIGLSWLEARDAPISQGKLFDDIGYLGDTTSTKAILEGTYEFPPDMDPHTRLLLKEAHGIFSLKTTEEISNFVSTEDFQYFWSHADEFIQSSYSHIHFGHYKATTDICHH